MVPRCLILLVLAALASGSLLDRLEEARSRIRRGSNRLAISSIRIAVPLHFRRITCLEEDMGCGPLPQLFELTCAVEDLLVGTALKSEVN